MKPNSKIIKQKIRLSEKAEAEGREQERWGVLEKRILEKYEVGIFR